MKSAASCRSPDKEDKRVNEIDFLQKKQKMISGLFKW